MNTKREKQGSLFPRAEAGNDHSLTPPPDENPDLRSAGGVPRTLFPERRQVKMHLAALDDLLPADHQARMVWEYVKGLDLCSLYTRIKSVSGAAGAPAIDPALLLALWLYATIRGIGSARELARRCREDVVFQWLCGGVDVNHHTLSDFRVGQGEFLDRLLTENVAALLAEGLTDLERVAQDGMRVRASAGSSSFRRRSTLEGCLAEAEEQVRRLKEEAAGDCAAGSKRLSAAARRAADDRARRVAGALKQMEKIERRRRNNKESASPSAAERQASAEEEGKKAPGKKKVRRPRVSTTDPQARVMKMADGGFRPAYNCQLATVTGSGIIVGVEVTNIGADGGQLSPMVEQLQERYGQTPREILADGGFAAHEDMERLGGLAQPVTVYAPPRDSSKKYGPYQPRPKESETLSEWRQRMGTPEAKRIYRERAATAEWANAGMRQRGLQQFVVRGVKKVRVVLLWFALAHNLMTATRLEAERRAAGFAPTLSGG